MLQGIFLCFMKYAMTMDGKIATYTNQSKWISGEKARKQVHQFRHKVTAIMVGVNTVIQDDPLLTCRLENGENPIRIVCDTDLRTPITSKLSKQRMTLKHISLLLLLMKVRLLFTENVVVKLFIRRKR